MHFSILNTLVSSRAGQGRSSRDSTVSFQNSEQELNYQVIAQLLAEGRQLSLTIIGAVFSSLACEKGLALSCLYRDG